MLVCGASDVRQVGEGRWHSTRKKVATKIQRAVQQDMEGATKRFKLKFILNGAVA
jgi:hypothetical protein